jgi:hypothetical protein
MVVSLHWQPERLAGLQILTSCWTSHAATLVFDSLLDAHPRDEELESLRHCCFGAMTCTQVKVPVPGLRRHSQRKREEQV